MMTRRKAIKAAAWAWAGAILVPRFAHGFPVPFAFQQNPTAAASNDITNGLIAGWKMNEGSGTTIADWSGNGYTGTFQGSTTPTWTTGPGGVGNAVAFNGTTAYIDAGIITQLYNQQKATLTAWLYRASNSDSVGVGQTCASVNCVYRFNAGWTAGGTFYQSVENGSASYPNFTNTSFGWHFYALVFDGSLSGAAYARTQPYMDGSAISQGSITGSGSATPPSVTSNVGAAGHFYFGHDISSGSYSGGAIKDCRVYNRALSSTEVATLNSNGARS